MNRTLYILSGAGDPANDLYREVYNLIGSHAKALGYTEVITQGWPGQGSFPDSAVLNQRDSVDLAIELLALAERKEEKYDVICRSFGTMVFLDACRRVRLKGVGFVSLWGIPAYDELHRLFVDELDETIRTSKDKGVSVDHTLFPSLLPAPTLLKRFDQAFPLNVLWGSKDKYCSRTYFQYLREANNAPNIQFRILEGLVHEVVRDEAGYLEALFNQKMH